jgi:hypothetical protein
MFWQPQHMSTADIGTCGIYHVPYQLQNESATSYRQNLVSAIYVVYRLLCPNRLHVVSVAVHVVSAIFAIATFS